MRTRSAVAAAAVLLLAACSTAAPTPRSTPESRPAPAAAPMTALPLASGARVFAWTRPGRHNAPWLLYVHGGSWRAGRGDSPNAATLAGHELRRGFQFFSVDYRLSQDAPWPAQRDDVAAAVDRIRAGASSFGIAATRGVILGESAGGQLAAVEASRGLVAGLVDLAGVVDPPAALRAPFKPLGQAARQLVGCAPTDCPSTWEGTRAADAITARTPPSLIVHSIADPVVPTAMSRDYASALRAAGRPVTLQIVKGRSHGVLFQPAVLRMADAFADRVTGRG